MSLCDALIKYCGQGNGIKANALRRPKIISFEGTNLYPTNVINN